MQQPISLLPETIEPRRILFILAGVSGAGKSTLLRSAFEHDLPIFGAKYHRRFMVCLDGKETRDLERALSNSSHIHAMHIPEMRYMDDDLRDIVLHFDLLNVMVRHSIKNVQKSEERANFEELVSRRLANILDYNENDILMRNYLSNPFFAKFDAVVINTLFCSYERNRDQYLKRTGRNIFLANNEADAKSIHKELYDVFRRNVSILAPQISLDTEIVGGRLQAYRADPPTLNQKQQKIIASHRKLNR